MQRITRFIIFQMLITGFLVPSLAGQEIPSYDDQREILELLKELPIVRSERDVYKAGLAACERRETSWSSVYNDAAAVCTDLVTAKDAQIQLYREKADFYETAYRNLTKGSSLKCKLAKIFTFGLARCAS